jgi:hypothetical protein
MRETIRELMERMLYPERIEVQEDFQIKKGCCPWCLREIRNEQQTQKITKQGVEWQLHKECGLSVLAHFWDAGKKNNN